MLGAKALGDVRTCRLGSLNLFLAQGLCLHQIEARLVNTAASTTTKEPGNMNNNSTHCSHGNEKLGILALINGETGCTDCAAEVAAATAEADARLAAEAKARTDADCNRCKGTGTLPQFAHINDGICYSC